MTISDGYGDRLTVDETLADYEAWLHARAHQMLSATDHRHDDLVQEGRVAMWNAHSRHDPAQGSLPAWLTKNANWRMREVLRGGDRWTGRPARSGNSGVGVGHVTESSLEDKIDSEGHSLAAQEVEQAVAAPDVAELAMLAYHRGEVADAITSLSEAQQRYVRLRFVEDVRGAELKAHFGYDPSALWNSAKNGAKHKLRDKLSHLEAA